MAHVTRKCMRCGEISDKFVVLHNSDEVCPNCDKISKHHDRVGDNVKPITSTGGVEELVGSDWQPMDSQTRLKFVPHITETTYGLDFRDGSGMRRLEPEPDLTAFELYHIGRIKNILELYQATNEHIANAILDKCLSIVEEHNLQRHFKVI